MAHTLAAVLPYAVLLVVFGYAVLVALWFMSAWVWTLLGVIFLAAALVWWMMRSTPVSST
jgi:hypothetical protein